jgi:hypothetical protein
MTSSRAASRCVGRHMEALIVKRDGYVCQMCGFGPADVDPYDRRRKVRLTVRRILDKSKGGKDEPGNLRAVCTNCDDGLQNMSPAKPDRIWLLSQIRRATIDDQRAVLEWLRKKYGET